MRTVLITLLIALGTLTAWADDGPEEPVTSAPATGQSDGPYWHDFRRGWHFYEDPEPRIALRQPTPHRTFPAAPPPAAPADRPPPEIVVFQRLQRQVEEYRNVAIINPTEDNVRRYMQLEAKVVRQASYFADVAQRVAWSTPELDMTLEGRPVNAKAIEVYDRQQTAERSRFVADIGQTHVLLFFFRSDCPYCHAFAPTLRAFQERHGIRLVPISVNGGGLPEFPDALRDNGIAKTLQVTQVPAVFLAEPFSGRITPIGYGVLSESQLIERISTIASPGADALVPSISRVVALPTGGSP